MQGPGDFFSVNKKEDWDRGSSGNLEITTGGVFIAQTQKYGIYRTIPLTDLTGQLEIYDFSVGQNGRLFLLDEHANVWMYDYDNKHSELLFGRGHELFTNQATMMSLQDVIILADVIGDRRLAAYSVSNGQGLWHLNDWNGVPLIPLATATDNRQYIYAVVPIDITEGNHGEPEVVEGGQMVVLQISLSGIVMRVLRAPEWVSERDQSIPDLSQRFWVAAHEDETVYVFDRETRALFQWEGDEVSRFTIEDFTDVQFSGFAADSHHQLYMGDVRKIGAEGEDDRFIMKFGPDGDFAAKVSGFRGRVDKLLVDHRDQVYVLNREEELLTVLELKQRTMEMEQLGLPEGIYLSVAFDSTMPEMRWHKVWLDANIPDETQIRISYFCSDRKDILLGGQYVGLDEYIRTSDISFQEKLNTLKPLWSDSMINPKDALFFNAQGRYIWLKLEFAGSEQKTPFLRKLRIYYPRTSYLAYLPAIYQEDQKSQGFVERFLSLFGTFFTEMEEEIGGIARYFDVDAVSGSILKWLGTWLGVIVDDSWNEVQLKELLKRAPELYKQRGTRQGIEQMIEIYTGEKPFIVEYFQFKQLREKTELRDLLAGLYDSNPYSFCVLLKPDTLETEKQRMVIEKILEDQKPAFTEAHLVVLQPWIYMDMHSYVGVNTYLSEPSLLNLDQKSSMPYNTVLVDVDLDNRIDVHTRLELDSELD